MRHGFPGWVAALSLALGACGQPPAAPAPAPIAPVVPAPAPPPPAPPPVRLGPTCTYHGLCWSSPLPQGNSLNAAVALAADRLVAVGDRGTVIVWDGAAWALEDTPTRERLLDVWASADGDLWAVGDHGTVLHREPSAARVAWVAETSPTELALRAIWGRARDEVFIAGDEGFVAVWNGTTWSRETLPPEVPATMSIVELVGRGPGLLYALARDTLTSGSSSAVLLARTGDGWRVLSSLEEDVASLYVDPEGGLVLGGADARHGDGLDWRRHDFGVDRPLDAIWGVAAEAAWAGGYEGRIARWNGRTWRRDSLDTNLDVHALTGTSESDVWAVGEHGLIAHRDAEGWTIVSSGETGRLEGVFGLAPDDVWAVGDHLGLHYDGHSWTSGGPQDEELEALTGGGASLLAVGAGGAMQRFANGAWYAERSGTDAKLEGAWTDGSVAFAVGGSEWLRSDGGLWSTIPDSPPATAVWGASANDVWAVGPNGLEHWDGAAWSHAAGVPEGALFAIWGASAQDVWAAGASGLLVHFDGASWSRAESGTRQNLLGLWGRGPADIWAVGHHGTVVHFDGSGWRWRDSGTDELLHSVWGAATGDVWIVGHGGVVLRAPEAALSVRP